MSNIIRVIPSRKPITCKPVQKTSAIEKFFTNGFSTSFKYSMFAAPFIALALALAFSH